MTSPIKSSGIGISRRPLLWITVLALILRLLFLCYTDFSVHANLGEGRFYLDLAQNLATGHGLSIDNTLFQVEGHRDAGSLAIISSWQRMNGFYGIIVPGQPTAYTMPLFPLWLVLLRLLLDDPVLPAQIAGSLMGAALVYLIGSIAWRLAGKPAGVAASLLAAIHPHFIYYSWTLTPQMGFSLCLAAAVLLFIGWREKGGWGRAAAMGLLTGAAWLLRTEGLELLLAITFVAVFPTRWAVKWLKRLGGIALTVLVALIMLLPWGLRNQAELGQFLLTTTSSSRIIYEFNLQPLSPAMELEQPVEQQHFAELRQHELPGLNHPEWASFPDFPPDTPEIARNEQLTNQALGFLTANPRVYLRLCLMRLGDFFRFIPRFDAGMMVTLATILFVPPLYLLGLIGLLRRTKGSLILGVLAGGFFLVMILIAMGVAYRATTFDVVWVPLAGIGAGWIWERIWGRKRKLPVLAQPPDGSPAGQPPPKT
jgi:4-amino-4-deoxy-L-arabinose transferase-like glycosyltransferase